MSFPKASNAGVFEAKMTKEKGVGQPERRWDGEGRGSFDNRSLYYQLLLLFSYFYASIPLLYPFSDSNCMRLASMVVSCLRVWLLLTVACPPKLIRSPWLLSRLESLNRHKNAQFFQLDDI